MALEYITSSGIVRIDEKGRVHIPIYMWKAEKGSPAYIKAIANRGYVEVIPNEHFNEIAASPSLLPLTSREREDFFRSYRMVRFDSQNRILIPSEIRGRMFNGAKEVDVSALGQAIKISPRKE